jgi:hypothetical protein
MLYLADTLGVSSCTIDHVPDDDNGKRYIDVIRANVKQLCKGNFDASKGETFDTVRGKINERLFFWDLKINDALQNGPAVVQKAYLVGYCLGALRWWYGLPGIQLDNGLKAKVLQYIPVLGPHLSQFAPSGLAGSIEPWWEAISKQQVAAMLVPISESQQVEGLAPPELQKQARIWYSLIAGECDALSYVDPTIRNRPYIWQVFQVTWPLFLIGGLLLLLIIAFVIYIIISYHNQIVTAITAAGGLLAAFGIAQTLQKNAGDILQKAVSDATATIKGSYLDGVWNATLQKEVNKAVFVAPLADKGKQAPKSPEKK